MNYLRVYKETQITNSEMLNVLKTLGFKEVNGDPRDYRMESTEHALHITIPRRPLDENILKAFTASTSHLLTEFGVIEDFDDLVKMVLKERAKKRKEEKKQMAMA
jgi:hypothetical protein